MFKDLISSYEISYSPSINLYLKNIYNTKKINIADLKFAGFAPVFDDSVSDELNLDLVDTFNETMRSSILDKKGRLAKLPFSKREIEYAANQFKNKSVFYYNNATESQFKKTTQNNNFNIVHISTHGFSDENQPELSCLAFAKMKGSSLDDDGFLFSGETYNLNLWNADLLVLSSCESGIGKIAAGEGMLSLTRGFLYAGVKNIIYSLWKINDKFTFEFMKVFYDKLTKNNLPYASALRAAKLEMKEKGVFPGLWASFVLLNN